MLFDADNNPITSSQNVSFLSDGDRQRVVDFLHGMVMSWVLLNDDRPFTTYDLANNPNFSWQGTPLMAVFYSRYKKHEHHCPNLSKQEYRDYAYDQAPKSMAYLLKQALIDSSYDFVQLKKQGDFDKATYRLLKDIKINYL